MRKRLQIGICNMAMIVAVTAINSTCIWWSYQPKETKELEKYKRKG